MTNESSAQEPTEQARRGTGRDATKRGGTAGSGTRGGAAEGSAAEREWLAARFEAERGRLRGVAYRMLGSLSEADDALQDAWLRIDRAGADGVENLPGWLTTVVARVCLNMLRSRQARGEEPLELRPAHPSGEAGTFTGGTAGAAPAAASDPEQEALLADSVGLALLVVLDALTPAERLAFVLHDMFAVPFDEIGPMLDRTPAAARQLASRARRRVRGGTAVAEADVSRQRRVVDAFLAASRGGDFEALLSVLAPDVVLHADAAAGPTPAPVVLQGAQKVARGAFAASARIPHSEPALVDGTVGLVMAPHGKLTLVLAFTVAGEHITALDVIADPERLADLELAVLEG